MSAGTGNHETEEHTVTHIQTTTSALYLEGFEDGVTGDHDNLDHADSADYVRGYAAGVAALEARMGR